MDKELTNAYEMVVEKALKNSTGTVNAPKLPKPGQSFEGQDSGKAMAPGMGVDSKTNNAQKPVEACPDLNPGHGNITETKKETKNMLPGSKFEALFKQTLVQEGEGDLAVSDENPVEAPAKFNDETGDFPSEGGDDTTGEEVDVATELRMIIDRLTAVAEKLGAYEEGEGEGEEGLEAGEGGELEGGDATPPPVGEAADGKLQKFPDSSKKMQSKGNIAVSGEVKANKSGMGATGGPGKEAADGKLKPFKTDIKKLQGKNNQVDSNIKAGRKIIGG